MTKAVVTILVSFFSLNTSYGQTLVVNNVNVINTTDGTTLQDVNVAIVNGRIATITTNQILNKGQIIEGDGKYLIPGLWDMHAHTWNSTQFFPLLIANGVTGIRDMFMNIDSINLWRSQVAEGKKLGPVIFAAGPIVDGPKPVWRGSVAAAHVDQVPAIIDSLRNKLKVDFIKVYSSLPRDVYFKIAELCNQRKIPFEGHLPNDVSILEAARAGQRSLEHLYGFVPESSDSASYLSGILNRKQKDKILFHDRTARLALQLRTFSPLRLSELIDSLSKYNTWICPTLTANRSIGHLNDSAFLKDERLKYASPAIRAMWNPANDFRFSSMKDDYFVLYRELFKFQLKVVKQLQDKGVRLLAGTDFPNPYCFPGFSLHDELELLVQAGLTPLEALQTATINPSEYFGISKDFGSVQEGKVASLVLLSANPLENISNIRKIDAVFVKGRFLTKEDLAHLIEIRK